MAGTTITVKVTDTGVADAMARLIAAKGGVDQAVLKNIGEAMLASTDARFDIGAGPDGKAWAPLNPEYAKSKKGPGILQESRQLRGTMAYQVGDSSVSWGSNKIYAAAQQFGAVIVPTNASALIFRLGDELIFAQKVTLPARPYLGISNDDTREIIAITEDHLNEIWH